MSLHFRAQTNPPAQRRTPSCASPIPVPSIARATHQCRVLGFPCAPVRLSPLCQPTGLHASLSPIAPTPRPHPRPASSTPFQIPPPPTLPPNGHPFYAWLGCAAHTEPLAVAARLGSAPTDRSIRPAVGAMASPNPEAAGLQAVAVAGAGEGGSSSSLSAVAGAAALSGELVPRRALALRKERVCTAKERISRMPPCAAGKRSSIYRGVTRYAPHGPCPAPPPDLRATCCRLPESLGPRAILCAARASIGWLLG
jgi:hypothetical protein